MTVSAAAAVNGGHYAGTWGDDVAIEDGFDWLTASPEARKILYRHTKRLIDSSSLTWSRLYREALGQANAPGQGYEDNFRSGRIGRAKAARLYRWIRDNHAGVADRIDADLGDINQPTAGAWEAFLAAHGRYGSLEIVSLAQQRPGVVAFAASEPLATSTLRLGEPFCFRLHSVRAGAALALQSVSGRWFPLPLSPDHLHQAISRGSQYLPDAGEGGEPAPLSEESDVGRHRFAVLVADDTLVRDIGAGFSAGVEVQSHHLTAFAECLEVAGSQWHLMRLNVLFVS